MKKKQWTKVYINIFGKPTKKLLREMRITGYYNDAKDKLGERKLTKSRRRSKNVGVTIIRGKVRRK